MTTNLLLQLTIQARDKGTPPLNSQQNARVTVTVARNANAPRFEGTPYSATVDRSAEVDTDVFEVGARDADNTVSNSVRFVALAHQEQMIPDRITSLFEKGSHEQAPSLFDSCMTILRCSKNTDATVCISSRRTTKSATRSSETTTPPRTSRSARRTAWCASRARSMRTTPRTTASASRPPTGTTRPSALLYSFLTFVHIHFYNLEGPSITCR